MEQYKILIVGILLGYTIGIITGLVLNKQNFTTEKIGSLLIAMVWLMFHIYWFMYDKEVAFIMDLIGAGATWNVAWLNVVNLVKSFKNG